MKKKREKLAMIGLGCLANTTQTLTPTRAGRRRRTVAAQCCVNDI